MEPAPRQPSRRMPLMVAACVCAASLLVVGIAALLQRGPEAPKVQQSPIWKPGTTWTVRVVQDASIAAPEQSTTSRYEQVYGFRVASAPRTSTGSWRVDAHLEGAKGPAAEGFHLFYVRDGAGFVLTRIAIGDQKPLAASYGPVLFGQAFPFQKRVTSTPRDRRIVATNGGAGDGPAR